MSKDWEVVLSALNDASIEELATVPLHQWGGEGVKNGRLEHAMFGTLAVDQSGNHSVFDGQAANCHCCQCLNDYVL